MKPKVIALPVGDNPAKANLYYGIDVISGLRLLPERSIHAVVTSPPYWGLRDYGTEPLVWGCDSTCNHDWSTETKKRGAGGERSYGSSDGAVGRGPAPVLPSSDTCALCGAWRGHLGLEPTPDLFVQHIVDVFREIRRVLRDDGTVWLNLGESYAGGGGGNYGSGLSVKTGSGKHPTSGKDKPSVPPGMKSKDLVGIPWMTALALQADGWYLRSACPWIKRNVMPESVTDRPTTATEMIFLLSKSDHYYYDIDAVRKSASDSTLERWGNRINQRISSDGSDLRRYHRNDDEAQGERMCGVSLGGRNRRNSDWWFDSLEVMIEDARCRLAYLEALRNDGGVTVDEDGLPLGMDVNTAPFKGAHFACFPPDLIEPMIRASTSEKGCCSVCGFPLVRIVERSGQPPEPEHRHPPKRLEPGQPGNVGNGNMGFRSTKLSGKEMTEWKAENPDRTTGWRTGCSCYAETVPCTVLDPFSGSGTTGMVSIRYGRNYIGTDLNPKYLTLAEARIRGETIPDVDFTPKEGGVLDLFGGM